MNQLFKPKNSEKTSFMEDVFRTLGGLLSKLGKALFGLLKKIAEYLVKIIKSYFK